MSDIRFWQLIVVTGFFFGLGSLALHFKESRNPFSVKNFPGTTLIASTSNSYLGPKKPQVGNPQLIQIQVTLQDSADAKGPQIVSAEFNGTSIPLQPRDIYGNRGAASFQVPPGKYKLRWKINLDKQAWPRTVSHEEIVNVSPRDSWLQILIQGDSASIH